LTQKHALWDLERIADVRSGQRPTRFSDRFAGKVLGRTLPCDSSSYQRIPHAAPADEGVFNLELMKSAAASHEIRVIAPVLDNEWRRMARYDGVSAGPRWRGSTASKSTSRASITRQNYFAKLLRWFCGNRCADH